VPGEVPEGDYEVPLDKARLVREVTGVSLIGLGATVRMCEQAAEQLAAEGVSAEVLDLRSLAPLDEDAILATLEKTGRVIVADEATPRCGNRERRRRAVRRPRVPVPEGAGPASHLPARPGAVQQGARGGVHAVGGEDRRGRARAGGPTRARGRGR
jgi:hypothetical protein